MTTQASPRRPAFDIAAALTTATELINAGRNAAAADLLKRLAAGNPAPHPRADYLLGVAAYRSGDPQTAVDAFRRCAAADPRSGAAQYGLAAALLAQGDREGARRALAAAELADPGITARRAPRVPAGRPGVPRPSPPPTGTAGAEAQAESLADILDRSTSEPPGPDELAGRVLWRGRPAVRSIIGPAVAPFLLLAVPIPMRDIATTLPAGASRQAATRLWQLSMSAAVLLAGLLCAAVVINWLMRELVIRERRIDIWTGLFGHRHVLVWLHDLERPLVIKQPLWQLVLNLGTLQITSTILPPPRRRQAATRLGHVRFSGLPIRDAELVAEAIWSRSLWERHGEW